MSKKGMSRRSFLGTAAAGALAFSAVPTIITPRRVEAYQPGGRIHPNVNPLRVVGVRDPSMIAEDAVPPAWEDQEKLVAEQVVGDNIDRMAMALAEEEDVSRAWNKILVKPAGKEWSEAVVAVKTNQIAQQRTRSAVMAKVCRVLTGVLGVKGENVHIYDARHGGSMPGNPFKGLPEGVAMEKTWGGFNIRTDVPQPYFDGGREAECLDYLVRDEVDVLINIALCKGHGGQFGGFTMCMKNHFGTFDPGPSHREGGGADYLIGINKAPEILGRMDARTGDVMYPRQQLCLVDALWGSRPGPGGPPTHKLDTMLMGVFGPAVDYVGSMRFRKDTMGWPVNEGVAARMLQEFGYSEADLPNEGKIIDALKVTA
ncbi:MAG: DUF362 domain-containing protein [Candidatus Brocadiia bacterium]